MAKLTNNDQERAIALVNKYNEIFDVVEYRSREDWLVQPDTRDFIKSETINTSSISYSHNQINE